MKHQKSDKTTVLTEFTPVKDSRSHIIVLLSPLREICPPHYADIWEKIYKQFQYNAPHPMLKQQLNPDNSVQFMVQYIIWAIENAEFYLFLLKKAIGPVEGYIPVPLKIMIDYASFIQDDVPMFPCKQSEDYYIEPGIIYVSAKALPLLRDNPIYAKDLPSIGTDLWLPLASIKNRHQTVLFHYQGFLASYNIGVPCFYCSSRQHPTVRCPSKKLEDTSLSLRALLYVPYRELNRLFLEYLLKGDTVFTDEKAFPRQYDEHLPGIAFEGFYQLKYIHQLRFMKALWEAEENDWEAAKALKQEGQKGGGPLWLAYDCLRIGNLAKAQSLLNDAAKDYANDFRYYVMSALLHIERSELAEALPLLNSAQEWVNKTPQRIFILFLIYRIHFLRDDLNQAGETIRLILSLDAQCREALLQKILLKLFTGRSLTANLYVYKFIVDFPDYGLHLLLDPDFAPFNTAIQLELNRVFMRIKARAEQVIPEAKTEIAALTPLFGNESGELAEIELVLKKIQHLQTADTYPGYLDIMYYMDRIKQKYPAIVNRRKSVIHDKIKEIIERCDILLKRFSGFKQKALTMETLSQLAGIRTRALWLSSRLSSGELEIYTQAVRFSDEFYPKLSEFRNELMALNRHNLKVKFIVSLIKAMIMFQLLNLIINLVFLPFLYELTVGFPMSEVQRFSALIGGALASVLAAIVFPLIMVFPGASKD